MQEDYEDKKIEIDPLLDTIYYLSDPFVKRKINELRDLVDKRLVILQLIIDKHEAG